MRAISRPRFAAALVAVATFLSFLPALTGGFLTWDDEAYLVANSEFLSHGWRDPGWMFSNAIMTVYQPLSWASYGLDYAFWGMRPFGFHLTNILLHALNAALFFWLALRVLENRKNAVLAAAGAALCFSIHPLRVESVAWVSERRDVLSGTFFLLTLLAYLKAARTKRKAWLAAAVAAYAAALLAKTFAVTLPAILVLLDLHVLRRKIAWLEKLPFVAAAFAASAVALAAQNASGGALSLELYGLIPRLCQGAFAPGFYIWKTLLPIGLSPMYDYSRLTKPGLYAAGALTTAFCCLAAWRLRRSRPELAAGWLFFLAVLWPVLGLVKTAEFATADRYTYLAGLPWALMAGAALARRPKTAAAVLIALALLTWRQCGFWNDSVSLWQRAASVDPASSFAHNNLAYAFERAGRGEDAARERRLGANAPAAAYHARGEESYVKGDFASAARYFYLATELQPALPATQNDLGLALCRLGRVEEGVKHFEFALKLKPDFADARSNLEALAAGRPAPR